MTVSMSARALLYDREANAGLVGSVFRQDPEKGAVFVDSITVPIVDYASDRVDRVSALDTAETGRYLVQFTLPSGQIMTETFQIKKGEETKLVVQLPHEGPHEWSSLEALSGRFTKQFAMSRNVGELSRIRANAMADMPAPDGLFQFRFFSLEMPTTEDSLLRAGTLPKLAALIRRDAPVDEAEAALMHGTGAGTAMPPNVSPVEEDNELALFELVYTGSIGNGASPTHYHFGPGTDLQRAYLVEESIRGANLVCLPVPWMMEESEYAIRILLDKFSSDGEPDYTLTIAHPMINSVLGYINNGALHEAAKLIDFDKAEDLLFHKISSPLAATIGGYLLVLGLDRSAYKARSDQWKNWIDNLYHWFEWLPDGAILKSANYFVLRDDDRDASYDALMTAFDRGLPFFTFGLNLMLEGMRRFANEGDATATERLKTLETIAAAADPSHNFLSIRVSQRW